MNKFEQLDRYDLECLVKGTFCPYEAMNDSLVNRCGFYVGGFKDEWNWNYSLSSLTDSELQYVYNLCKQLNAAKKVQYEQT